MQPGTVAFIPGWIILLIVILTISLAFPKLFFCKNSSKNSNQIINPLLLALIIGSLMPAFDDFLAFVFGPPFAHHSLFHSFLGPILTFILFRIISNPRITKFAVLGNICHILFNFYLDYVAFLYPLTNKEFGLSNLVHLSTYNLKVIHYPIIFLLFAFFSLKYFLNQRKVSQEK